MIALILLIIPSLITGQTIQRNDTNDQSDVTCTNLTCNIDCNAEYACSTNIYCPTSADCTECTINCNSDNSCRNATIYGYNCSTVSITTSGTQYGLAQTTIYAPSNDGDLVIRSEMGSDYGLYQSTIYDNSNTNKIEIECSNSTNCSEISVNGENSDQFMMKCIDNSECGYNTIKCPNNYNGNQNGSCQLLFNGSTVYGNEYYALKGFDIVWCLFCFSFFLSFCVFFFFVCVCLCGACCCLFVLYLLFDVFLFPFFFFAFCFQHFQKHKKTRYHNSKPQWLDCDLFCFCFVVLFILMLVFTQDITVTYSSVSYTSMDSIFCGFNYATTCDIFESNGTCGNCIFDNVDITSNSTIECNNEYSNCLINCNEDDSCSNKDIYCRESGGGGSGTCENCVINCAGEKACDGITLFSNDCNYVTMYGFDSSSIVNSEINSPSNNGSLNILLENVFDLDYTEDVPNYFDSNTINGNESTNWIEINCNGVECGNNNVNGENIDYFELNCRDGAYCLKNVIYCPETSTSSASCQINFEDDSTGNDNSYYITGEWLIVRFWNNTIAITYNKIHTIIHA